MTNGFTKICGMLQTAATRLQNFVLDLGILGLLTLYTIQFDQLMYLPIFWIFIHTQKFFIFY